MSTMSAAMSAQYYECYEYYYYEYFPLLISIPRLQKLLEIESKCQCPKSTTMSAMSTIAIDQARTRITLKLESVDPEIYQLIQEEEKRQRLERERSAARRTPPTTTISAILHTRS